MKKPKQLDPYRGGLSDTEFLSSLGISTEEAQDIADMLEIPLSEKHETIDDAEGKPPYDLEEIKSVKML